MNTKTLVQFAGLSVLTLVLISVNVVRAEGRDAPEVAPVAEVAMTVAAPEAPAMSPAPVQPVVVVATSGGGGGGAGISYAAIAAPEPQMSLLVPEAKIGADCDSRTMPLSTSSFHFFYFGGCSL